MIEAFKELIFKNILYAHWYTWFDVFKIFLTSMIPVLELRAAIAFGPAHHIPWIVTYVSAVAGNLLPVPFIILFIRKIFSFLREKKLFGGIIDKLEKKAEKNKAKVQKYAKLGLFLFVAVPLPGTGAWTGSLVAAMLDMRLKYAFPSIALGVATAGVIMTFFYYFLAALFPGVSFYFVALCVLAVVLAALAVAWLVKRLRKNKTEKKQI